MSEKLCGIYCIENTVNGKKYIGLSRDIKRRWTEHKSQLTNHTHVNPYLQKAWDKHGGNVFEFKIIELCSENQLSERERYYIQSYQTLSHQNGYNLTVGGENTSIGKLVIRLKDSVIFNSVQEVAKSVGVAAITMTAWCREKRNYMFWEEYQKLSPEEQIYWQHFDWESYDHQRLSQSHTRDNLSQETLQKMSKASSGHHNARALKVFCPQLNEVFDCMKYASEKYGVNKGSISLCIKKKLKSAGKHPITGEKLTWELVQE